jgi:hypothetical protein
MSSNSSTTTKKETKKTPKHTKNYNGQHCKQSPKELRSQETLFSQMQMHKKDMSSLTEGAPMIL